MATAEDVLNIARAELGYNRYNDPEAGTKYGRWYAQDHGEYFGTTGVPFCVMFASWCLDQAGVSCDGMPAASASVVYRVCNIAKADIQPGDIIVFDFNGMSDGPDHVGICEENTGSYINSIDGNVGNGQVLRRSRPYSQVVGAVRPNYDGASAAPSSQDEDTSDSGETGELLLDCDLGKLTVAAWARQMGLSGDDADGYISYQYKGNFKYLKNFSSLIFNYYDGCPGSPTAKAIQRKVGSANVDGVLGQVDIQNIQHWLNENFGYHMLEDGICGPTTAYNIQHSINKGFWS